MVEDGWPVLETVNPLTSSPLPQADCYLDAFSAKIFVSNFGISIKMMCGIRLKLTQAPPLGNVLSLDFSASNQYLISGGADNLILRFDISRPEMGPGMGTGTRPAQDVYRRHDDSVRSVSAHPHQDEVFLSASEDGKIILHDARVDRRLSPAQGAVQHATEFTGVQTHPVMEHIFATSDSHGQVCLRDTRMAFGPLSSRSNEGIVQNYNTKLSKHSLSYLSNPESSSITFDRDGSKFAVTMLHWFPTIYAVSDPHPLAVLTGKNNPDGSPVHFGERTYSNSCTMKSGAFGGPGMNEDILYGAGSDDFRGYVWKIPEFSTLSGLRQEINADEWMAHEWAGVCAYSENQWATRYIPLQIDTPLCRLNGHRSIVNAVAMHPSLLHIVTSGIERHVLLHSPTCASPVVPRLSETPSETRRLGEPTLQDSAHFLRTLLLGPHPTLHEDLDDAGDEEEAITLFDHILNQEGGGDVFTLRHWGNEDSDAEDDHLVVNIMDSPTSSQSIDSPQRHFFRFIENAGISANAVVARALNDISIGLFRLDAIDRISTIMFAGLSRQTRLPIEDSNIAVLGRSEFDAKYQVKPGSLDPVWEGAGKKLGITMWRVDQSGLVTWPDETAYRAFERLGYFYDEDAYILLRPRPPIRVKGPFCYDIHYWIGNKAMQEETATAVYKSIELDERVLSTHLLHPQFSESKQALHREAQGQESQCMLALFPVFMVYKGGKFTNWHHPALRLNPGVRKIYRMWTTTYKIYPEFRLYSNVKGKQTISYELDLDDLELEQGGLYCYDSDKLIALYCTKASSAWDRFWVGEMVMYIGYTRLHFHNNFGSYGASSLLSSIGRAFTPCVTEEGTPREEKFREIIGVKDVTPRHSHVPADAVGSPAQLYRLSEVVPRLAFSPVQGNALPTLGALESKEIYILDDYGYPHDPTVYVWVGKDIDGAQARIALVYGEEYLKDKRASGGAEVSISLPVVRIWQGRETTQFLRALGSDAQAESGA
ncbi:WD40-repeat-containing domain protein [Chiua virens]|nr:WD40-repeat-containing domain protein [Chiua virens]